jgi:hypothetical protein
MTKTLPPVLLVSAETETPVEASKIKCNLVKADYLKEPPATSRNAALVGKRSANIVVPKFQDSSDGVKIGHLHFPCGWVARPEGLRSVHSVKALFTPIQVSQGVPPKKRLLNHAYFSIGASGSALHCSQPRTNTLTRG